MDYEDLTEREKLDATVYMQLLRKKSEMDKIVGERRRRPEIMRCSFCEKEEKDLLFTSPSYAAIFVIGKSENGLTRWKTQDGISLKELEAEQANYST